ncbi:MAG: ROK family protein, partial [Planctomycetes bacterium]|nr:ROK family protein [Planctomycetota bacterium]
PRLVAALCAVPLPVFMDNSNRYSAYAEMRTGAARDRKSFLVMDGEAEGLGAGLVLDGVLWHGGHYMAGEIGHMIVDPTGSCVCHCGARGCLETVACVATLVRGAKDGFADHRDSLLFSRMQPGEVSFIDVYDVANAGDEFAQSLVDAQARWLAIGIVNVTLVADPDLVILQGPYARGGDYLLARLLHHMSQFAHPRLKRYPEVVYSRFGRERVLVGGSHYVADRFYSDESLYE